MILRCFCIWICFLICGGSLRAQTFTYNVSNSGCDGQFGTRDCWTSTDECQNNNTNLPLTTAVFSKATGCPVNIVIEQGNLTLVGNIDFGGVFQSLKVKNNSTINFNGNLAVKAGRNITFNVVSGNVNVLGDNGISLENGTNNPSSLTTLNVIGSEAGFVNIKGLNLANRNLIKVSSKANLINSGPTVYAGNTNEILVDNGFYRTRELSVTGNQNKLNVINSGIVIVDGDVTTSGNQAGLSIGGGSTMEIGGVLDVSNNSSFVVQDGAILRMCGEKAEIKNPNNITGSISRPEDCLYITPVEWHQVFAKYQSSFRSNSVNWSTLKEWENSHFEIERSIGGVNNYQKIGRVEGMGWADEITEYSFCDDDLPLKGGRVYYRIKQVDFDGTFDYSQTMMVNVPGMQVTKGEWRAYPNPIRGQEFQIARLSSEDLMSDIQVKILTSQIPVASFKVKNEEELNAYLGKLLPRIPQGIFVVELQSNKRVEYLKVIKE